MLTGTTRPTVEFNPASKAHRGWFGHFINTGSMRDCPVQFTVRGNLSGNPIGTIQRTLLEYYTQKEFAINKKTVDSIAE